MRSNNKCGPINSFDVYWTQTDRQTDKQSILIDEHLNEERGLTLGLILIDVLNNENNSSNNNNNN